ncbi:NACHT domain-containing NTPase [Streptomyces sp. XD-27]|uniref:NACHT domain-containing protein n=1 Tax=Streptomyces sp. XD-27 TaxID=3062779 RepID=UPI0026F465BB|nr:NACHT domain-containing protein [Streptomyces sp. XD-27]WKX71815.1 NACHT domain-containing protein [Streptomyces sp. XD-27]
MSATLRPADRAVVVLTADGQGSGVLLTERTAMTSAHVVAGRRAVSVAHPSRADDVPCKVAWLDERLDAAVLYSAYPLLSAADTARLGRIRLGRLATHAPLPHCEIVGFPAVQRYGAQGHIEYDQYEGSVLPLAGALRDILVFETARGAVAEPEDGGSAYEGLSGAPVFAGPVLLGIVKEVPRGRLHRRLEAVPVASVFYQLDGDGPYSSAKPPGVGSRTHHLITGGVGQLLAQWSEVTDVHPHDHLFEEEYARALRARYGKTRLFGVDALSPSDTTWDLDTAYLALEAESPPRGQKPGEGPVWPQTQPGRVHDLLADRPRVLLRGEAGAGKTTLVWWLAAHTACGTLGPELAALDGLVPFVVPMRALRAQGGGFPAPARLPSVAGVLADDPPEGWARRVLVSGRAFLLVDGLDEVPASDRAEAHAWLSELLALYPQTRCLVTVRPGAVDADWLRSERFEELKLLSMREQDIQAFVAAWHRAARLGSADQSELAELEEDLKQKFSRNAALRALAGTPLLCAVICALHRRRGGLLPETRWELYRATLSMLLGDRDNQRRICTPEGIRMGVEEHQQLLQTIAVWLVRGGQAQLSRAEAEGQLTLAMRLMPRVRDQGAPAAVLTHLLNRSGLLHERGDGCVQFIHRTFQDYLAAKALVESGGLKELLRHAGDEQWQDVILMAVGHCRPAELGELIEGLIEQGDAVPARVEKREKLHILAARCALDTVVLADDVRQAVDDRIRAMLPPSSESLGRLMFLGPGLLPHLPGPGGLDEPAAWRVATLIGRLGGREAIPYARRFADSESERVRQCLAQWWLNYPAEPYATEVLARLRLDVLSLTVCRREELPLLRHIGPLSRLVVQGPFPMAELRRHLAAIAPSHLAFHRNPHLTDIAFLRDQPALRQLRLLNCPQAFRDLDQTLPGVSDLVLLGLSDGIDVTKLRRAFPSLIKLSLIFLERGIRSWM